MLKGSGITTSCFGISKTNSTFEPGECEPRGLAGAIICGASALLPKTTHDTQHLASTMQVITS